MRLQPLGGPMVAVGCQSFPSSALASSKQRAILSPLHLLLASVFAQGRWQLSKYSGGPLSAATDKKQNYQRSFFRISPMTLSKGVANNQTGAKGAAARTAM
jgi:hypothetical protein